MKKPATKRPYRKQRRAESQDETRARIVEATIQLHEELGPRAASISAIAERAGVQRLTVYRHFPDDNALFQACTGTWLERFPPPSPALWADIAQPDARMLAALQALYDYYQRTGKMWRAAFRDEADVPALEQPMATFRAYLDAVAEDLAGQWRMRGKARARILATSRLAVHFSTWSSLHEQGLDPHTSAELVTSWLT